MGELEDYAIKKVAKGGFVIFSGMMLSLVMFFFYKIFAARYLGPAHFGLLILGITTLNLASIISLAGVHQSIGKLISHHLAKNDHQRAKGTIISSFIITIALALLIMLMIYFSSSFMAEKLFRIKELGVVLRIFAIGIPFSVITQLLKYHFFAFKKPEFAIISESISEKMINFIFLILVVWASASLYALSWAYVTSLIISSAVGFFIISSKLWSSMKKSAKAKPEFGSILSLSVPLMMSGVLSIALAWTDIIFIGIFRSNTDVGIYNAAYIIASSMIIFWLSFADIFYPIISDLYAKNALKSIRNTFNTATRWVFAAIIPILVLVLVYPERIISLAFGSSYVPAGKPLSILIIGYFFTAYFGLSEHGLMTFGRAKFLGVISLIGFFSNMILNLLLIPRYGVAGAATATTLTLVSINVIKFLYFRKILMPGAVSPLYLKYTIASVISIFIMFFIVNIAGFSETYYFIGAVIFYLISYGLLVLIMRSLSLEDIEIIKAVERKFGIDLRLLKNFIK